MDKMKLVKARNINDFKRIANDEIKKLSNFTVGRSSFIDDISKRDVENIETKIKILHFQYDKLINDVTKENVCEFVNAMSSSYGEIIIALKNVKTEFNKFTNNKGFIEPYASVIAIIQNFKKYGFKRDAMLLEIQLKEIYANIYNYFTSNYKMCIDKKINELAFYCEYYINELELLSKNNKKEIREVAEEIIIKNKTKRKIFNHKEMNDLMLKNGFEPVRQNGSHKIFSNGEISIPVPQHDLGKGLSFEIQKQIKIGV